MTKVTVLQGGGYRKRADSKFGELYAVLKVDGSEPGKVKFQYDMLDAGDKVLATFDDTIKIGQGKDMIKISTRLAEVPDGTKNIRVRVVSNTPQSDADDVTLTNVKVTNDGSNDRPVITGQYAAHGESTVYGFRSVCSDASGRVVVSHGLADSKNAKSGSFSVKVNEAPQHWRPTTCYVGQSGLAF